MKIVIDVNEVEHAGRRGVRVQYHGNGIATALERAKIQQIFAAIEAATCASGQARLISKVERYTALGNG